MSGGFQPSGQVVTASAITNRAGLSTDRPAASVALTGVTWTYTDVGSATYTGRVDRCDGSSWVMIVPPTGTYASSATAAARVQAPVATSMIDTFQAGHAWTDNATTHGDDTGDYMLGFQSHYFGTSGAAGTSNVTLTVASVDCTGQQFVVAVKISDPTLLGSNGLSFFASTDPGLTNYYRWNFEKGTIDQQQYLKAGEWGYFTLNLQDASAVGTPDLARITTFRIQATDAGTGAVTIHCNGVGLTPAMTTAFPHGVVSLCFDDANASQFTQAKPYMDKYGFPGTAFVIKDFIDDGTHLSLAQLQQLEAQSGWEVAGHSYSAADHASGFPALAVAGTLESDLTSLHTWLTKNGFRGKDLIAYPLGNFDAASEALVRKYFTAARTIASRDGHETLRPANPYRLRALSIANTDSVATVTGLIDKAYANGGWLIITVHDVATPADVGTKITIANFQTIIDYLSTKGIPVRTIGDVLQTVKAQAPAVFPAPAGLVDASAAPSRTGILYARTLAGRERFFQRGSTDQPMPVATEPWAKSWTLVSPQGTTSVRTSGVGGPSGTSGTISHPGTTANGYLAALASAASAAAAAYISTNGGPYRLGATSDQLGGFFFHSRGIFPDASYDNTGASTGSRLWAGIAGSFASVIATDRGSGLHAAAFVRAHVNGGSTDTNWQFVTNSGGGTPTVVDTAMPFTVGHMYSFYVWCPRGGTTVYWRIQDLTAGTTAAGQQTATLPGAAILLNGFMGVETVDAVSRTFQFRDLYVESDVG